MVDQERLISRRELFKQTPRTIAALWAVSEAIKAAVSPEKTLAALPTLPSYRIEPVIFEAGRGRQSIPWIPVSISREGERATALGWGGMVYWHDYLDITLNGANSLASQTGEYSFVRIRRQQDEGLANGSLSPDWSGRCYGSASASWGGSYISGPINLLGYDVPLVERMQAVNWQNYANRYDEWPEVNEDTISEAEQHFEDGEGIAGNYTPIPGQEWWGVLIQVLDSGRQWVLRDFRKLSQAQPEGEDRTKVVDPTQLSALRILHYDGPQPGKEGAYYSLRRDILGLMSGTHRLVVI